MKKAFIYIWRIFRNNLSLKIIALIFAVILWSYVLYATNPAREKVISDITVRYENAEDLKAKDLAIVGSFPDDFSVDIRVKINQKDLSLFNAQGAQAFVDLSGINATGTYPLKITAISAYGQVLEVNPLSVTLTIDRLVTKQVPVIVKTTGSVPSGYYAGIPEISPDYVNITGAQADIKKVTNALCVIELDGLTSGYNKSVDVTLSDDNGNAVPASLFSGDFPSVMVKLSVLPVKTVTVDAASSIIGQDSIAPGYEITGITSSPKTVQIVGEKAVIDTVSSVRLVSYSVSGFSSDIVVPIDFAPTEGVTVLADEKAVVTVNIREITSRSTFTAIPVGYRNLSAGLTASFDTAVVDVTVIAGQSRVSKLKKSSIVPFIDLDGLTPGTYTRSIQFEVPQGFTAENFSSSVSTVTVTVKKK